MKTALLAGFTVLCLCAPSMAQEMYAPKPPAGRTCRILLYVKGSNRALDYNDVIKVHTVDQNSVTFETHDGYIVFHQGPFTLIGPKTEFLEHTRSGRVRFYDAK